MSEPQILWLMDLCREGAYLLLLCSWQAVLLLGLTWLFSVACRNRSAAIRHNLWLAGLISVIAVPVWIIIVRFLPVPAPSAGTLPQFANYPTIFLLSGEVENNGSLLANISWLDWLACAVLSIWIVGVLICLVRLFFSYRRIKIIRLNARPAALENEMHELQSLPADISIRYSPEISSPLLAGIFRPVILLPTDINEWTSAEEKAAIIRHEAAHVARRDHFILPFQNLLKSIFFFHPLVRYALNQLSFERESACDERVLSSGIAPENYTEAILKVAEHDVFRRESQSLAFNPVKKLLNRRINRIMNNRNKSLSRTWRFLLLANAAFLLAAIVWFAAPANTAAQNSSVAGQTTKAIATDEQTTESFKRLYEEMKEAILKGDKAAFENFFAEDYTAVSARGTTLTRQQVIDVHIQKPTADTKLETVNFNELKVKIYGDTVIVTYLAEMSGLNKGAKFSQRARITDVWEKKNGKWQSVASHASNAATQQ